MASSDLRLEVEDGVAVLTMQRHPVNALSPAFRAELIEMFDALSEREDVRAVVLASALRVFSAGADLKAPPPSDPGDWGLRHRLSRETKNSVIECAKPVVAAINGPAIGAGFGLAGACDILVASEEASVSMTEIDVGLAGGASLLHQYFGRSRTRRMILTGMSVSGEELYRLGIVEACVPADRLMETAMGIAAEIASKDPLGIKFAKRSLNLVALMPPRDAYRFEQDYTFDLATTRKRREDPPAVETQSAIPTGPVGVIGFGMMGSGLAASLRRSGREVVAYDMDPSKQAAATEIGAAFASSPKEVLANCEEVLLVLPDGPDVEAVASVLFDTDARGKLVVDCSTVDPEVTQRTAALAAEVGAEFADAGMGGGVSNAVEGTLLFMVGCDESSWPRARSLLLPIARDVVRCGGPGTGVTMKAIVNLLWLANYTADVEALVFAASAGISPEVASAVLGDTGASNRALGMAVDQLIPGEIRDGFPVRLAHKDVRLALATARRLGLDLASLEPTLAVLQEASADGMDGLGVAAYGKVIEDRHGIDLSRYSGGDDPDAVGGR